MNEIALRLEGACKSYPGFALQEVGFSLPRGHVMGLVGPNGAGKTTVIKLIMNLVRLDRGSIQVFGLDHLQHEAKVKRRIGFVYDDPPFYNDVTLQDTRRAVSLFYPKWNDAVFDRLAKRFDLPLGKRVKTLSTGMRTQFALALALSHDADLLILDEPTTGLDPAFRRELLFGLSSLLQEENKSILYSTHITSDLERMADYITVLRQGRVALTASLEELRERWGVVRGDAGTAAALDPAICRGSRRHAHGVEVLTCDLPRARQACPADAVVEPATLEEIVLLMNEERCHV